MHRVTAAIPIVVLTLMLFGRSTAMAMSPPCDWFTRAEMGAALGAEVSELQEKRNMVTDKPRGCLYKTADVMRFAALDAYERDSAAEAQKTFAQITKDAARLPGGHTAPIMPIQGVGDEAANVANVLYVRKGALVFSLAVFDSNKTPTTTPTGFAKAKSLVQAAWSRI